VLTPCLFVTGVGVGKACWIDRLTGFCGRQAKAAIIGDRSQIPLSVLCAPSPLRSVRSRPCWSTLRPISEEGGDFSSVSKTNFSIGTKEPVGDSSTSIPDLLNDLREFLPNYTTLSFNTWGLRSLLYSTFFNLDIECNLISA
jgi:hypothetical protein